MQHCMHRYPQWDSCMHCVAASETVTRNVACNVSGVDFHSTSATLPAMISSCVHPLKQALRQITQFTRSSANHVLLTRRELADQQNN